MSELHLEYETSFVVMPSQTNFRFPQIFGGAFMAEIDLCAAAACTLLLQHSDSPCNNAVTYRVLDITFHKPCQAGDLITLSSKITGLRQISITVQVEAHRFPRDIKYPEGIHAASATLVFVTKKDETYYPHGLVLPSN